MCKSKAMKLALMAEAQPSLSNFIYNFVKFGYAELKVLACSAISRLLCELCSNLMLAPRLFSAEHPLCR